MYKHLGGRRLEVEEEGFRDEVKVLADPVLHAGWG